MSATDLVNTIVERLVAANYRMLGTRVRIGSVPYQFAAVLLGPPNTLDLVIVIDSGSADEFDRVRQRIEGVGRALDMAGSRRTITSILAGQTPDASALSVIRAVGRYLLVPDGPDMNPAWLEDRLAILLPLELTVPTEVTPDPVEELLRRLNLSPQDTGRGLISALSKGSAAVEAELKRLIETPLNEVEQ